MTARKEKEMDKKELDLYLEKCRATRTEKMKLVTERAINVDLLEDLQKLAKEVGKNIMVEKVDGEYSDRLDEKFYFNYGGYEFYCYTWKEGVF
jgi:undecaprenyl pyrophosphate synthase